MRRMTRAIYPRNPTRKVPRTMRRGLSLDEFETIRSNSPHWFACALDVAVTSGLRRDDMTMLRNSNWNGTHLTIPPWMTIEAGRTLKGAIEACRSTMSDRDRSDPDVFLISRDGKGVSPKLLTYTFAKIRDQLPCFARIPRAERPTWHHIRALALQLSPDARGLADAEKRLARGMGGPG